MNCKMLLVPAFIILANTICSAKDIKDLASQAAIDQAIKENKMVVIDYHAEKTCGPCKQMAKVLKEVAPEYADIQFVKVDVNQFDVAEIHSVPTFVLYLDQKEVKRFTGSRSKGSFVNLLKDSFNITNPACK